MRAATVSPSMGAFASAAASPPSGRPAATSAIACAGRWKSSVRATKSVSQPSSTSAPTDPASAIAIVPSAVARPSRLAALARPRSRSRVAAFSMSPPASVSAFLQSIMPAPVRSRRSFTAAAEISATLLVSSCRLAPDGSADLALARVHVVAIAARAAGAAARAAAARAAPAPRRLLDLDHHAARAGARALLAPRPRLGAGLRAHALLVEPGALDAGLGDVVAVELDRARRVVVGRDHEVDPVRVAVAVHDRDDRDAEALRFRHRDVLALHVDHEQRRGQPGHLAQALEALAVALHLAREAGALLLAELGDLLLVGEQLEQLLVAVERLPDGAEVGERAAQPAVVDVELAGSARLGLHGGLRLPLGADEQQLAAVGRGLAH